MLELFDFAVNSLFDLYICKGNFGRWIILRLLDLALLVCVMLSAFFFLKSFILLGILCIAGAIWSFVVSMKMYSRLLKQRREKEGSNAPD